MINGLELTKRLKDNFDERRKEYNIIKNENINKFQYELKLYNELLDKVCVFIKELGSTELEYCIIISYLINRGYLSNNLTIKRERNNLLIGVYGLDIIKGEGMCQEISYMTSDILSKMNVNNDLLYCYIYKLIYIEKRGIFPNHIVNLVNYNNTLYGIDISNYCRLYHFINSYDLREIRTKISRYKLKYKPYKEYIDTNITIDDLENKINKYNLESNKDIISSYDYLKILDNIITLCDNNKDLFLDFHNQTQKLKAEIDISLNKKLTQYNC